MITRLFIEFEKHYRRIK